MKNILILTSTIVVVAIVLFAIKPKHSIMDVEDADVGSTYSENVSIALPADRADVEQIENTTSTIWSAETEAFFAPLISESKTTTVEKFRIENTLVDGTRVTVTNWQTVSKRMPVDINAPEVVEYVQIAWARAREVTHIPDGVVPTAMVIRDNIVVHFPWLGEPPPPPNEPQISTFRGYSAVLIDIKTKAVKRTAKW